MILDFFFPKKKRYAWITPTLCNPKKEKKNQGREGNASGIVVAEHHWLKNKNKKTG